MITESPKASIRTLDVRGDESMAGRLQDLVRLQQSPVITLVMDTVKKLREEGRRVEVGISTEQAIQEGENAAVCLVLDRESHGLADSVVDPARWTYGRVDISTQRTNNSLRLTIKGWKSVNPYPTHDESDVLGIQKSLKLYTAWPRYESTHSGPMEFPVRGFQPLSSQE